MQPPKYQVWVWFGEYGHAVYVGWGPYRTTHPAIELWQNPDNSPLGIWLALSSKEPRREDCSPLPMFRNEARALAVIKRSVYEAAGVELLSNREFDTHHGGGPSRMVMDPTGRVFVSVRKAAAALDVNSSTVSRWCASGQNGWKFV